jgi:phage terminase large subunit GpA-like protein
MISLFEFDPYKNRGKKKRTPKKWDSTPLKICPGNTQGTTEEHTVATASAAMLRVRHHALGMVGYVISREGASRLLKLVLPLQDKAIDQVRKSAYTFDTRLIQSF